VKGWRILEAIVMRETESVTIQEGAR